jgi:hypothetical protein
MAENAIGSMRYVALILVLSSLLAGSCRRQPEVESPAQLDSEDYGELSGVKGMRNAIGDELNRIIEEGGTPELLNKTGIAEGDNVAVGLLGLFLQDRVESILKKSEEIFPSGKFEFDPIRLQKAINFRSKYDAQRLHARDALGRPKCDFGIQFKAGFLAELKFIDEVRIAARLEAFQAAESLSQDKPQQAIESLGIMLRLASCLAAEKSAVVRLEAAFLRTEAFVVLQAIVQRDCTRRKHLDQLYQMVQKQLKAWTSDADAWIGDRAMGLHAYEMVRAGDLASLLTEEEMERFEKEDILDELMDAAARNVNQDELYYMETMRKIIDSCAQPYFDRVALFDSINHDLQQKWNSPDFPIVAARLLLPNIQQGHVIQAQDRANWEAWAVALAMATGRKPLPYRTNPLTGKEYHPARFDQTIEVSNFGSGKNDNYQSIIVPIFAGGESDEVGNQ